MHLKVRCMKQWVSTEHEISLKRQTSHMVTSSSNPSIFNSQNIKYQSSPFCVYITPVFLLIDIHTCLWIQLFSYYFIVIMCLSLVLALGYGHKTLSSLYCDMWYVTAILILMKRVHTDQCQNWQIIILVRVINFALLLICLI